MPALQTCGMVRWLTRGAVLRVAATDACYGAMAYVVPTFCMVLWLTWYRLSVWCYADAAPGRDRAHEPEHPHPQLRSRRPRTGTWLLRTLCDMPISPMNLPSECPYLLRTSYGKPGAKVAWVLLRVGTEAGYGATRFLSKSTVSRRRIATRSTGTGTNCCYRH